MKSVTFDEFMQFMKSYPRPLEWDITTICEPPVVTFNDFTLGNWPESIVAQHTWSDITGRTIDEWKIKEAA